MPTPVHNRGYYWAELQSAQVNRSPNKGTLRVEMIYVLKHDAQEQPVSADEVPIHLYLTGGATERTEAELAKRGFTGDYKVMHFADANTWIECKHEEYPQDSGTYHEKWEFPYEGAAAQPASDSDLMNLNAQWKAHNQPAPKPAGVPGAPPTGGQIPFDPSTPAPGN